MAVFTKTIFQCDICKKEVDNKDDLKSITLPVKVADSEGRQYFDDIQSFDLCKECLAEYSEVVRSRFISIRDTLGHIEVKRKNEGKS